MASTKVKRAQTIPPSGTYVTDCDQKQLFRIEAVDSKGVMLENCRSYFVFILSVSDYKKAAFREI